MSARPDQGDATRPYPCPKCGTPAERGFKAGQILMLRCRECRFKWSEVVHGTFGGVIPRGF